MQRINRLKYSKWLERKIKEENDKFKHFEDLTLTLKQIQEEFKEEKP